MQLKITTLVDNYAWPIPRILAEHGLCFLVETRDTRILLDSGQLVAAKHNAGILGLDLKGVIVTLSHGHYDHTGGLPSLLEATGETRVYAHPGIFDRKYKDMGIQEPRYIGIPQSRESLEDMGASFHLSREPKRLAEGIWLTGEIPRNSFEDGARNLLVEDDHGLLVRDEFQDDQALVVELEEGLMVVTGCAHSGIINTLEHARFITGCDRILGLVGGTHLGPSSLRQREMTLAELSKYDLGMISPCHCTGPEMTARIYATFGERTFFNGAGNTLEI